MKLSLGFTYIHPGVSYRSTVHILFSPQLLRQEIAKPSASSSEQGKQVVRQAYFPISGQASFKNGSTGLNKTLKH